ncbi:MAG: hypothetical protein LW697_13000 [Blastopirellula sp.]|nr:hypothetical protein [Blastopirellula sp.]
MSRSVTNRHFKGQKLSQLPQILTGLLAAYIVGLLVDGSVCAQTSPTPVYDPYFLPTTYQQGVPPPTYQPFPYAPPPTSVPPPVYPQTTVPGMTYPGTTVPPPVYGTPAFGAAPTTTLPPVTTLPPMTTAPPMVYNSPQTYVPGVAPPPMDPFAYNSNPYPFGTVPPTQPGMPTGTSPTLRLKWLVPPVGVSSGGRILTAAGQNSLGPVGEPNRLRACSSIFAFGKTGSSAVTTRQISKFSTRNSQPRWCGRHFWER